MSASKTKPKVTLRPATEQDSVAITNVVIRAFPADPQWYYRLPHWKEYPEDHFKYSEERIRGYQSQVALRRATYFVAEVDEDGSKKIVGLAMYQMPGTHLKGPNEMEYPPPQTKRRDIDPKRHEAYFNAIHDSKTAWFDKRFGERQMYLAIICVDPNYQGCGAGSLLLQWGIDRAVQEKVAISLFASPVGRRLYLKMGFKDGGWTRAQVDGEEEYVDFPGMYWVADEKDFPTVESQ